MTTFRKLTAVLLSLLMAMPTAAIAEETPAPTPSVQPTALPSASPSAEPTADAAPTASAETEAAPTASAEPTASPSASAEASADPTAEPTPSASADVPTLQVYQADDAADMAAAVSTLDDSSENRIVVTTDHALSDISASGSAVYYDGTYVVSFDNASEKNAAVAQIEEKVDASAVIDDTEVSICEGETPAPTEKPSEIADQISTETKQNAEEGLTLREKADQAGKKLVAIIDTGVNGIAEAGVNLTSDPDDDANGHGTRMAQYVLDASENQAMILSIKAIGDNGKGTTSNVYAAVKYAIEARAEIINLSISARDSAETGALKELIASAIQQGIIVAASAGNDSADASGYVPAVIDGVLTAGSCDAAGSIKSFSNYGSAVDYLAVSDSTSEAAAKLSGWTAAGKTENNAELFRTDAAGNAVKPAAPTAESSEWKTNTTYVLNSGAIFNGAIKDLAGNRQGSNDGTIDTKIKSISFYTSSTANPSVTDLRSIAVGDGVTAYWNDSTHSIYVISSGSSVYSATTMQFMFRNLQALESVDVTNLDTSNTTVMSSAFENCYSIKSLNLSSLNTDNVLYMASMFSGCHILESITFSPKMTTGSLTTTASMFFQCNALTALDLSKFNTSRVDDMNSMFFGCKSLTSLDLSSFNTSSVKNMYDMFDSCIKLTSLTFGTGFNTSNVTNMSNMFSGCTLLSSIDLRVLNTTNVTNMSSMFDGCSGLTSIDLSVLDTANVTDMGSMFSGCSGLTSLTFGPNFKTLKVTTMESMFSGCRKLGSITFGDGFATSKVTNMQSMFFNCANLSSIDVSKFNTASVTTMAGMFQNCSLLGSIDLSHFDTSKVTTISSMFADCPHLSSANLSTFNTPSLTNMGNIFWNCSGLSYLDLSFDAGNVTTSSAMFNAAVKPSTIKTPRNLPSTIAQRLETSLYDHGAIATPNIVSETLISVLPTGDASSHLLTNGNVVSFNGNGGTTPKSIDVLANGTAKLPGSVLAGKKLTGWYTDADAGMLVGSEGSDYTPTKTITLYAHWVDDINGVTYQQGTADSTVVPAEQSGSVGDIITLASNGMTKSSTTENQLTVTLNGNGGSVSPASIVSSKTRTYKANGWTKTSGSETQDYANGASYTIAAGNLNLYPCFTQLLGEQSSVTLPTPTRTGYTFAGWYTAATGGTKVGEGGASYTPAGNTTLYAQWAIDTYTISYALDGGTNNASNPANYNIKTATFSLGEPTRTGYTFTGWSGSNGETAQKSVTIPSGSTGTKNYTAHWTANTYTVAYDGNGRTSGSTASSTHTYDVAQALTANGFSRAYTVTYDHNYTGSTDTSANAAYAFAGWNTNADGSGTYYADNASVMNLATTGTFNLYAQWTSAAVALETPSRTGYTFAGWYTAATGGTKVGDGGASYTPTADVTLYAQWTIDTYTISYALDGGTNNALNPASYNITTATISLGEPTRTGYTFTGWTGSNGETVQKSVTIPSGSTGPKSYTAHWTANTYTVAYNGNGITSGSTASSTHTYDVAQALTANGFSRAYTVIYNHNYTGSTDTSAAASYTFAGWNTNADGSATSYANQESVINLAVSGAFNLYAQWTSAAVTLETPSRTGYTFAGWYTAATGGTKVGDGGASYTPTADVTLYAQWTVNTYTVTYAQGTASSSQNLPAAQSSAFGTSITLADNQMVKAPTVDQTHTVTFNYNFEGAPAVTTATADVTRFYVKNGWTKTSGSQTQDYANGASYPVIAANMTLYPCFDQQPVTATVALKPAVSRTGYTFAGWYTEAGTKAGDAGAAYTPISSLTLYAHWNVNSYTVTYANGTATGGTLPSEQSGNYASSLTLGTNRMTKSSATENTYTVTFNYNGNGTADTTADSSKTRTYTKNGWTMTSGSETQDYANGASYTVPDSNLTLYPCFTQSLSAQSAVALPAPTRTGYTFAGWYDAATGGNKVSETASYVPASSITLYAHWNVNSYTVTYANGTATGGTLPSEQSGNYASSLTLGTNRMTKSSTAENTYTVTFKYNGDGTADTAADSSKTRTYTANGWTTTSGSETQDYTDVASYTVPDSNLTLYPCFTQSISGQSAVALPAPTRTGYIFAGWYDAATGGNKVSETASYVPSSSITLYAHWTPISYKVHFDASGGIGSMTDETLAYDATSSLTANAFARAGYHFTGWSTTETGTIVYTDHQAVRNLISDPNPDGTSGITLYAQWAEDADVTINYASSDMAMGTVSSDHESIAPATGTAAGSTAEAKPGYHFVSWTDQSGTAVSAESSFAPAKIEELNVSAAYTANFAPNIYTIKFDGNSGTGTMADQSLTYGVSAKLSSNSFTLNGFSFSSWNTVKDGSGTSYNDAEDVVKIALDTAGTDHAITLYAQWRINPEQSSFRVLQSEITEVPEALKAIQGLDSPARIEAAMRVTITDAEQEIPTANIEVYDVRLQFSTDEGKTWIDATKDNFPKEGITVVLPYPEGTNASSFNFVITHMFTIGEKAGSTENLSYVKTPEGLQVHVTSLSPFAIGYVRKASAEKKGLWCITYLDSRGNTVSVQWVETGKAPIKPAGYSYPDISNVSANQDVRPTSDRIDTGYVVPNTADQG